MIPSKSTRIGNFYLYCSAVVLILPVLCGFIITTVTFFQARHNVAVWRQEFQLAIEKQCPAVRVNITSGAGRVYLDANKLDYQWVREDLSCASDGRVVRCSCRSNEFEYTDVTGSGETTP